MTNAWRPEQAQASENNDGELPSTAPYAIVGGVLVVIAGLIAMLTVVDFGSDDGVVNVAADAEIIEAPLLAPVFQELGEEGIDPFFPLEVQLAGYTEETGETPTSDEVASGLYGGTLENSCDPDRLVEFLMSNPERGEAWAHVQGIAFDEIPEYIGSLTVRTLAAPSTVLNHHFDQDTGQPYEIETTLETGTAVLVDDNGDIRARCYCGNPIKPKEVGHRPPRCVVMTQMVYARPGDTDPLAGVPGDVVLTGRTTADETWTEISWGSEATETGWTTSDNLSPNLCFESQAVQAAATSTPEAASADPTPAAVEPTATRVPAEPTPASAPAEPTPTRVPATPTPAPPPPPAAATAVPTPTTAPTEVPTVTPVPQPFQPFCSVDKRTVAVGESVTFSAGNVPDSVVVEYRIAHGDGSSGGNPSTKSYDAPGSYLASASWEIDGRDDFITCGTIDVTSSAVTYNCSISETTIRAGGTTTFTGTTDPSVGGVSWEFDHGDGYREVANPSVSLYREAGNYSVTAFATFQGQTTEVNCGTVQVVAETVPVQACPARDFIGQPLPVAQALADSRGCPHRDARFPGTTDYRPERLNFHVGDRMVSGQFGIAPLVEDVTYG